MEADERYRFTLDGQLATLDDYLEVRPEAAERVRRLVEEGRLAIGPWQVLMDEFLVSGETIVRNLEHGQRRAAEFGGAMPVGYLPDMFGHVAQMPQILRQAGIGTAVVWRGVPGTIDSHSFEGGAGRLVRPSRVPPVRVQQRRVPPGRAGPARPRDRSSPRVPPRVLLGDEPILAMFGTDHMEPLPQLIRPPGGERRRRTGLDTPGLPRDGRRETERPTLAASCARAPGRTCSWARSARLDLKAAMARAERALARYAEPFQRCTARSGRSGCSTSPGGA